MQLSCAGRCTVRRRPSPGHRRRSPPATGRQPRWRYCTECHGRPPPQYGGYANIRYVLQHFGGDLATEQRGSKAINVCPWSRLDGAGHCSWKAGKHCRPAHLHPKDLLDLRLGGGLGVAFGAGLAAAAGGAAGRTGGTLGGCGRCSIPPTGHCSSTQRRQASANFSRSPSTFHMDVENARSHGPMFSAMTRRRASPPLCRRKHIAAKPATVPWRYSAMPPSPLRAPRCRASRSAGHTVSTVPSPRWYRRSAEEWGFSATTTTFGGTMRLIGTTGPSVGHAGRHYAGRPGGAFRISPGEVQSSHAAHGCPPCRGGRSVAVSGTAWGSWVCGTAWSDNFYGERRSKYVQRRGRGGARRICRV